MSIADKISALVCLGHTLERATEIVETEIEFEFAKELKLQEIAIKIQEIASKVKLQEIASAKEIKFQELEIASAKEIKIQELEIASKVKLREIAKEIKLANEQTAQAKELTKQKELSNPA